MIVKSPIIRWVILFIHIIIFFATALTYRNIINAIISGIFMLLLGTISDICFIMYYTRSKMTSELKNEIFNHRKTYLVRFVVDDADSQREEITKLLSFYQIDIQGWYRNGPYGFGTGENVAHACLDVRIKCAGIDYSKEEYMDE